jgi:hypothetical protein
MVEKNVVTGIAFMITGTALMVIMAIVSSLGYEVAKSVPIASFGAAVAIIGALIFLLVPEPVPQDAYKALLNDAVRNVAIILEERAAHERAYFFQTEDGEIRAFIPITQSGERANELSLPALLRLGKAPVRIVVDFGDLRGLSLIPPGAQLVKLARVEKGASLEEAVRSVLVEFSDLASSVLVLEEEGSKVMKIQIGKPTVTWDSPSVSNCLGSSVSCIAGCVAAVVKGQPVRIVEERFESDMVSLSLEPV